MLVQPLDWGSPLWARLGPPRGGRDIAPFLYAAWLPSTGRSGAAPQTWSFHTRHAAHAVTARPEPRTPRRGVPSPVRSGFRELCSHWLCVWGPGSLRYSSLMRLLDLQSGSLAAAISPSLTSRDPDLGQRCRSWVHGAHFTLTGNLRVLITLPHGRDMTGRHFRKKLHLFLYLGAHLAASSPTDLFQKPHWRFQQEKFTGTLFLRAPAGTSKS